MKKNLTGLISILIVVVILSVGVFSQTTEITYQGQLQSSSAPANGNFNMTFSLYTALLGGVQVGSTINQNVAVANGIFSARLDFGASAFPGADRFLEINVAGTVLSPRSQITLTPYAIRALTVTGPVTGANAAQTLLVTNSQPGITNPSPANLPPTALRAEATATSDSNAGLLGIGDGTTGIGVIGVSTGIAPLVNGAPNAIGVLGLTTATSGKSIGLSGVVSSPDGIAVQANSSNGARLFFGSNNSSGGVFTVDAAGNMTLSGAINFANGNFTVASTGALNAAGNRFTVDANGNAIVAGTLQAMLLSGGSANICESPGSPVLRFCSSSLRYKKQVHAFAGGLDIVNRLRPIAFTWKENNVKDVGLGAEDVAKVDPLFTFRNDKGEIEGVKYNQLSAVFVNAFKEQQAQISLQQRQIDEQKQMIMKQQAGLRALQALFYAHNRKIANRKSRR